MDGDASWWTTSGNIGLPPLARVIGVGRQQQHVVVPYVDAVIDVTVIRVLLCVLHVFMLMRECEGARVTTMLVWGMDEVWLW